MDRRFLEVTTADVMDSFYKANVEVVEETRDSLTVKDVYSGVSRTFLKKNDPVVVSYMEIENPTLIGDTEELLGFLNREEDESGNHLVQEQLRLEEQFGSYSALDRTQSLYVLGSMIQRPKEIILLSSIHPEVALEQQTDDMILSFSPNPQLRSRMYVPILGMESQTITDGSVFTQEPDSDFTNSSHVDLRKQSYEKHGTPANILWKASETPNESIEALTPTRYITEQDVALKRFLIRQSPPVPYLLYDVRHSNALTYQSLKVQTCMKQDALTRSNLYVDIQVPIFTPPLQVPLMNHVLNHVKILRTYKRLPKTTTQPLICSPYSYTVIPRIELGKIGLDTDLVQEEYERHYVSLTHVPPIDPFINSMDAYMYSNLYRGIDIDSYHPKQHIGDLVPYTKKPYVSAYTQYVSMPYIPEPVNLTETEMKQLEWCITQFPAQKPLVESYRLTRTPKVWFEFMSELYAISHVSVATQTESALGEIREQFSYPTSHTLTEIQRDIKSKRNKMEEERRKAESNTKHCYGLSIRKLYVSLESFQEDIASHTTLYWDSDRDSISSDLLYLRKQYPDRLDATEEEMVHILLQEFPMLSAYEVKRRAHEIVQHSTNTPIRPGDLIMIRLPNASYIYQKTTDGWTSRTQHLDETEYCETNSKGYIQLTSEQLTGKQALEDGCTFLDKQCVPVAVQRWITLLEHISAVENRLRAIETLHDTLEERKDRLMSILERMLSYSRVLSSIQSTTLSDDSWATLTSTNNSSKSYLFTILDRYEKARAIPDFTTSWLEIESVLDQMTSYDSNVHAFVDPSTRTVIACEHVSLCIAAAKSSRHQTGHYMRQLLVEYGNYDEVGQQAICKLCGEEIGDLVVSTTEGFGNDDIPVQVRTVTDVAVNTDYQTLTRPAQAFYTMALTLRDQSGLSIDESELVRSAGVWYNKFLVSPTQMTEAEFILALSSLQKQQTQRLALELITIRKPAFLRKPDIQRLLQTQDKRTLARNKKVIQAKLLKETKDFFYSLKEYAKTTTESLSDEDLAKIRDYMNSSQSISSELREAIFGTIYELKNVSHSIMILVYAIQTASQLTRVGLATVPGYATLRQEHLYEEDHSSIIRYFVYIYAKKGQLDRKNREILQKLVDNEVKAFQHEDIQKQVNVSLLHLNQLLASQSEIEKEFKKQDRVFTPNRSPFEEEFTSSFSPTHPIQSILETYKDVSQYAEQDPGSISPNIWMDYRSKRNEVEQEAVFYTTTLAQDIMISRFPLSMKRLESMKESNEIESIEQEILSFCSQYNLETGRPLRKLIIRSGGSLLDRDEFTKHIQERFPASIIETYRDWIEEWIHSYTKYAGPVGSVLEYDLDSLRMIGILLEETKETLVGMREASESDEVYRKRILTRRNRIRSLIGQTQRIHMKHIQVPTYDIIPRPTSEVLPDWYVSQQIFVREQIEKDTIRLTNYLTQMNVGTSQQTMAIEARRDSVQTMYSVDFTQLLTSLYFDIYRNKTNGDYGRNKEIMKLAHELSNGEEILDIESKERYEDDNWKKLLDLYGKITENVIEVHTASVLAHANRMRKQRADKFTEEERGLNRIYREFQLGRQFKSIDEFGMEAEVTEMDQQFIEAELIDEEEAMELMMGMGEDEGQYEMGEYETL